MCVCVCAFIMHPDKHFLKKVSHYMALSLNCDYSDRVNTCQ